MIEKGVSHIAYFRTDGGSSKLYTQEYVDEKDKEIERLTAESTKWESKYYEEAKKNDKAIELLNAYTRNYMPGELYIKEMLLDILKGE